MEKKSSKIPKLTLKPKSKKSESPSPKAKKIQSTAAPSCHPHSNLKKKLIIC